MKKVVEKIRFKKQNLKMARAGSNSVLITQILPTVMHKLNFKVKYISSPTKIFIYLKLSLYIIICRMKSYILCFDIMVICVQ